MSELTAILEAIHQGDPDAPSRLLPLVYDELRRLAAARMAGERPDHTLSPTALVNEAYLRLFGGQRFDSRGHFFAAAAEAMRRILVDAARRRRREKHGGELRRVDLDLAQQPVAHDPRHDLIALDEALTRLAAHDAQAARPVELRYFAGLSIPEAAEALGVSRRTADRVWAFARAWLHRDLTARGDVPES